MVLLLISVAAVCSVLHANDVTPKQVDPVAATRSAYQLQIDLDANGRATIDGKEVDEKVLVEIIGSLIKNDPEASILVCASEKSKFEPVSNIMNICRKNGVKKFAMSTKH